MNANSLKTILLVKAVEEQDTEGTLLPAAERESATRAALRQHPTPASNREARTAHAWRVLEARASALHGKLVDRHPVVARTVMLESHVAPIAMFVLVAAALLGLLLSLLDSRVRIEILAFPLLGLVLWNLLVYAALAVGASRRVRAGKATRASDAVGWVTWPARWGWRRATGLVKQAAVYHRPLAAALRRFSEAYWPVAQPLMWWQGKRLFHVASAAVAVGLLAGFYVRGIALEYRAGWESTFLGPTGVRRLLHLMYGPASAVSGIDLPSDDAAIEALHWREGKGGGPAAAWIHLIAITAILFVVIPRLLLAVTATIGLHRASRSVAVPESLTAYARNVLGGSDGGLPAESIRVQPYAWSPTDASLRGAQRLLLETFGTDARVEHARGIAYGEEGTLTQGPGTVDVDVVLMSLAATPETENHGVVLAALRDRVDRAASHARGLLLVDESPFLERMQGDATLATRIEQRREAWRTFAAAHGLSACLVELAAIDRAGSVPTEAVDALRRACRTRTA